MLVAVVEGFKVSGVEIYFIIAGITCVLTMLYMCNFSYMYEDCDGLGIFVASLFLGMVWIVFVPFVVLSKICEKVKQNDL